MDKEGTTLATEIFQELKASARRWFVAFLIMVFVEIGTIAGFIWYISLPIEEAVTSQEMTGVYRSNANQFIGDE